MRLQHGIDAAAFRVASQEAKGFAIVLVPLAGQGSSQVCRELVEDVRHGLSVASRRPCGDAQLKEFCS